MINVAFLLLVFLLLTAVLAPPDPVDVAAPVSVRTAPAEDRPTLIIDAGGTPHFGSRSGDAALDRLPDGVLQIKADANLPARTLARLLAELATRGHREIHLLTRVSG